MGFAPRKFPILHHLKRARHRIKDEPIAAESVVVEVPDKAAGQSVAEQTKEILAKIDGLLAQGGTDKSKLLQAVIWLQDIRVVDEFNKVWDAWVVAGSGPARACIEARLQSPAKMIEIQVTAAR